MLVVFTFSGEVGKLVGDSQVSILGYILMLRSCYEYLEKWPRTIDKKLKSNPLVYWNIRCR